LTFLLLSPLCCIKQSLKNKAVQIAKSLCPLNKENKNSHVAFLIRSGIIEKIGTNKKRTHPETRKHPYHEGFVGIHAELDCLLKMDKEDLSDYNMLVIRVDNNGKLNMSKPCEGCQSLLQQFNIKEVWYSDPKGQIIKDT
jgi:deoxycytidylate deaminase